MCLFVSVTHLYLLTLTVNDPGQSAALPRPRRRNQLIGLSPCGKEAKILANTTDDAGCLL